MLTGTTARPRHVLRRAAPQNGHAGVRLAHGDPAGRPHGLSDARAHAAAGARPPDAPRARARRRARPRAGKTIWPN